MINFKNKKILVLGGSGLIGKSLISKLLKNGAHVINVDFVNLKIKKKKYKFYNLDVTKNDFIEKRQYDKEYFDNLIELYESNSNEIDTLIEKNSDIILQSLSPIDRSILRLAICELVFRKDVPKNVIINESINIAKKYSSKDAYKFINTMLDKLITKL